MQSNGIEKQLVQLTQQLRACLSEQVASQGVKLTFFQGLILQSIAQLTPCTAHDIVLVTQRDKAQITRIINELIKQDMVQKCRDAADKRQFFLSLTEPGERCAQQIARARQQTVERMLTGVSDVQQHQLMQLIVHMQNNLT